MSDKNQLVKQNEIQSKREFQNICIRESGKVVTSAHITSSDVLWRRILHK